MIKINLAIKLAEIKKNQRWLVEQTGIRAATVSMYWHETIQRINVDDLNKICKAINCNVSELIEYIPDED